MESLKCNDVSISADEPENDNACRSKLTTIPTKQILRKGFDFDKIVWDKFIKEELLK
jgi:hypothetical protein